jgi:hypothetical protein
VAQSAEMQSRCDCKGTGARMNREALAKSASGMEGANGRAYRCYFPVPSWVKNAKHAIDRMRFRYCRTGLAFEKVASRFAISRFWAARPTSPSGVNRQSARRFSMTGARTTRST